MQLDLVLLSKMIAFLYDWGSYLPNILFRFLYELHYLFSSTGLGADRAWGWSPTMHVLLPA